MLSPNTSTILDEAVKFSISMHMYYNVRDCLNDNGEPVDITPRELLNMFCDCEAYIKAAETEIDFNLDGSNVFTGRYMLVNTTSDSLLKYHKDELIKWASELFPVESKQRSPETDDFEFFAIVWLAYLKTNMEKVKEFYMNERLAISNKYLINQ